MFSCPIQIRMCDLDPFNHVNNGSQCHLFDYGRTQYFENLFNTQIDWLTFELVIVHLEIDYKLPIFIHDKVFCETEVYELGNSSIKMVQRLVDKNKNIVKTICKSVLVYIDRESNTPRPLPESYRNKFLESV